MNTETNTEKETKQPRKSKLTFEVEETDVEGISETEIAAEISVPVEGGWGWVVVAGSFMCVFILDGVLFTFGSIYQDMSDDMDVEVTLVALVNSVACALYGLLGPIVSALINRFGFRSCAMTGSVIISISFFASYFVKEYILLLLLYGIFPGIGGCFIYMSSQLVVGFYFERLRAMAMAIAGLGQSFGVMIMFVVNTHLVRLFGWRIATLFHSGLFGIIYFIGMLFRPLLSITVTTLAEDTRTITYLPSLSTLALKTAPSTKTDNNATAAERLFMAVSNVNFPTAAEVIDDADEQEDGDDKPGPSVENKFAVTARSPRGGTSQMILRSRKSKHDIIDETKNIEITLRDLQPTKKAKWLARCCHWEKHVKESRPMYRDDVFYTGKLEKLPAYQKSMMDTGEKKTGLEYRMAVSRTVTTVDLKERKGVFTTAFRRILATMMDPSLLKRCSFLMVCTAGFFTHTGILIPYIFISDRNRSEGIEERHCTLFVSVIGFANAIGKLIAGVLGSKLNPVKIYALACMFAGTAIISFNFCFNPYYQYFCCVLFGLNTAHMSVLRSLVLVDLYGLDNLTSTTGMILMFQGFGIMLSTPLAGTLKKAFGFTVSFCVAGSLMIMGGLTIARVKIVAKIEERKKAEARKKAARRRTSFGPSAYGKRKSIMS